MNYFDSSRVNLDQAFFKERVVFVGGPIDDGVANRVVSQMLLLASNSNSDITLYINSPGGSVSAGLAIHDTMQHISCDVKTVGIGMCASMGAFLLCSGTAGKRFVLPNTQVLIHQPLGGVAGQASDIAIAAQHILETRDRINQIMSSCTGKPIEIIARDLERDNWKWGAEAVEYGLADEVVVPIS